MAYELLAIDLDDTLLRSDKTISTANFLAIKRAQQAGIRVILASGRGFYSIDNYNKKLDICDYTIAEAGGQIVDKDGSIVYSKFIPPILTKSVMRWAAMRNIHFQLYLDDGFHYLTQNKFSDFYESQCNYKGIVNPELMQTEDLLSTKILFVDDIDKILEYKKAASAAFPELSVLVSQPEYLEFFNPDTSKGEALRFIAEKAGIGSEQIVAIGDSEIDISMLKYAGLGVALQNAGEPVQQAADRIAPSCDDDGVAQAINSYVLK